MPEIVTKFPDDVYHLLADVHVTCGKGDKPTILTQCPKEKFCQFPRGEMCVYSINEVSAVHQFSGLDIFLVPSMLVPLIALGVMIFLLGMMLGLKMKR